jgi:hypothetical protein
MAIISWSQNSTHIQLPVTLQTSAGTALDMTGLTGTAIAVKTRPAEQISAYTALSGVATMTNASLGQFTYKFAVADVAAAGNYKLVVSVTFGINDIWTSFEQDFVITQTQ